METPIIVALIAAAASAITFMVTKTKEREAGWRALRIEQYQELISAMSGVAGEATDAERRRLALAANHVGLFASRDVLRRLTTLLDAVASGNSERHDEMLTELIHAIRTDLDVPGSESQEGIRFRLWAAGHQIDGS